MDEHVKKKDVLDIILGSSSLGAAYTSARDLQPDRVISIETIEKSIEDLKLERDSFDVWSDDWGKIDNTIDTLEWAIKKWMGDADNG